MNNENRKILMEYLGGCWHKIDSSKHNCCICGLCFVLKSQLFNHIENDNENRLCTFTTEADMMALYKRLHETGKWEEFITIHKTFLGEQLAAWTAWLFCLFGEGYEERCQMVADWLKRR